jgi:hypothetical protein
MNGVSNELLKYKRTEKIGAKETLRDKQGMDAFIEASSLGLK